jgi:proton glutamate symport protein
VASFVIPTGYSFDQDGSTPYLALASLAIARAADVPGPRPAAAHGLHLGAYQQGVAGLPRATLVILATTCGSFGLPGEAGVAMLLAVDEIMDMARATINVIGNGLASVVVAKGGVFCADAEPAPDQEPCVRATQGREDGPAAT